ncbi:MAG TPA: phosphomevalonate kinase [Candidatus Obscuribacterales bacterium]
MQSLSIRVPGKLLLAGEYAILEPGSLALVLGVNRYLNVELNPAAAYSLSTDLQPEAWNYTPAELFQGEPPANLTFAVSALRLGWQLLQPQLEALPPFGLHISSQLHDQARKLGLGSSAAVCVGVLAALLAAVGQDPEAADTRRTLFRLALLAHRLVQGSGSGADLAGCIHGSVTAYTSPDFDRIPFQLELKRLLTMDWPMLALEKLPWPQAWGPIAIGWSGAAADTASLIPDYLDWQEAHPEEQTEFLFESRLSCLGLREALQQSDSSQLVQGLGRSRRLLQRLDYELQQMLRTPALETPALAALADAAEALGGAGKFSGAGGGDCGLAWVPADKRAELHQAWKQAGIEPLDLELDTRGVHRLSTVGGTP